MEKLNREEIIELINSIKNPKDEWSEDMVDKLIFKLNHIIF